MDDELLEQVFMQHGLDGFPSPRNPLDPASPSPSVLHSFPVQASFDHGYFLTVRAIQELRDKRNGSVCIGIGGPSGSGKSSLAAKIASVFGGIVIAMEDYYMPVCAAEERNERDRNDVDTIDFSFLIENIEDLRNGKDVVAPHFDFQEKVRYCTRQLKAPVSGVVIVEGTYALHFKLRSYLDIRVAVIGGVQFSLLSKVRREIGESFSLDKLIDSIFPTYRKHIEPDLHHAQIRISNTFKSSLREPYYILKMEKKFAKRSIEPVSDPSAARCERYLEMYLMPPMDLDASKTSDWMKMRQCGIRYYLEWGDQRIVDKNFIIKPRVEFEVGKTTLSGLLALGYKIGISYRQDSVIISSRSGVVCIDTIDDIETSFVLVKGTDRKIVAAEASTLGLEGPWITKSYLEMVLERKGPPRIDSPPLPPSPTPIPSNATDTTIVSPQPVRLQMLTPVKVSDIQEPWTRSPTKSELEYLTASWHIAPARMADIALSSGGGSSRDRRKLLSIPEAVDFDRGLLLAVQGVQALFNANGPPVIVGIGGPSGSGKASLARKMANIVGCEVISMENYYKSDLLKDFKYDDFASVDLPLLIENVGELRALLRTKVPIYDFEKNCRSGFKDIEVSEDCGVVIIEGVYALHPDICIFLDMWIAVIGGVHSHLVSRVQRDVERSGRRASTQEIMTTVFPMFQQHIEPHLVHAHLKIRNDFDPVHSSERSMFVLKSSKEVNFQEIVKVLDPDKLTTTIQGFTDIYLRLPGLPTNGIPSENSCIRVRLCEGRYALLIREPIREGDFIVQPKVDFDISVRTVAGLLNIGYQPVAYLEATATIYQDDKLLIEVDYLKNLKTPFIQIKGSNKETVARVGSILNLEGSYKTMPFLEIVLRSKFARGDGFPGLHDREATRVQQWVDFVQSQGGSSGSEDTVSPTVSMEFILEELQMRVKRLEKWQITNTILWTIFVSGFVAYTLYHRNRHYHT